MDFIYFDVGGVVILDFSKTNKWDELLENIGVKGKDKGELNRIFTEEEYRFCAGEKDADTFIEILTNRFNLDLPENYSFLDDFVNRFESNPLLAEIIRDLKQKYQIGLLTNMYPNMLDGIKSKGLLPNVYWDVIVDSSEVGFQKPQAEMFKLAVDMAKTPANKILFVENSKMHIDAAKKLGWNTFLYNPSDVKNSNKELLNLLNW